MATGETGFADVTYDLIAVQYHALKAGHDYGQFSCGTVLTCGTPRHPAADLRFKHWSTLAAIDRIRLSDGPGCIAATPIRPRPRRASSPPGRGLGPIRTRPERT